jgi:hypothetical protein
MMPNMVVATALSRRLPDCCHRAFCSIFSMAFAMCGGIRSQAAPGLFFPGLERGSR